MQEKIKIVAVVENHFDQIWRRCFKRDILWEGRNYVSYEKIECNYINKNLELADSVDGYKFQIENICAVETYLERFPEKREKIKSLYADGILKTTNTGYVILDSNFVGPETIIRNYLISDAFFDEYMGGAPKIANRCDAFGNSAQLPQILCAFGADYVTEISYTDYDDDVWVGLDKSAVCVKRRASVGGGGGWEKYPPCSLCKGFGIDRGCTCVKCGGKGIDLAYASENWRNIKIKANLTSSGVMRIGGEEFMPSMDTPDQIKRLAVEKNVDISLGHWDYLVELYRKDIEKVKRGDFRGLKVRESPEFNLNNTGAYVSRIKIKQKLCDKENNLLAVETLEAMNAINGISPRDCGAMWRNFLLCGFHDSAAGTIVDSGYDEIIGLFDVIDTQLEKNYLQNNGTYLFNPTSSDFSGIYDDGNGNIAIIDRLSPYSFEKVSFEVPPTRMEQKPCETETVLEMVFTGAEGKMMRDVDDEAFTIDNDFFTVETDDRGIISITDKRKGTICHTSDGLRPLEWIIQSDNGSPWATLEPPYMTEPLKESTKFVCTEKGEHYTRICYETKIPIVNAGITSKKHIISWSLTLFDGYDRIRVKADVKWTTVNKRLMLCLPIAMENGRDIYGIPGGWLEREPYEPTFTWNGADGNYPTYRYGGVESDTGSVALLNRGTPAYKILTSEGGRTLYVTLLRSPFNPTYLHEPDSYSMTGYDGMRDEGDHSFEFEIASYGTAFRDSSVVKDAEQFCRPPLPVREDMRTAKLPTVISGSASVTHVKPAEDGDGIIVRVTEHGGIDSEVTVSVPQWASAVYISDMPEKKRTAVSFSETLKIKMRAFEIATLRLCAQKK